VVSQFASVPTPWQPQMPCPPVGAEERAERAELKPARVQFARILLGRHETADVCAPKRNPRQSGVDRHRHMRLQCLPGRIDVARPEKSGLTLHSGMAVAMQREDTFVRTELLRAFEI